MFESLRQFDSGPHVALSLIGKSLQPKGSRENTMRRHTLVHVKAEQVPSVENGGSGI